MPRLLEMFRMMFTSAQIFFMFFPSTIKIDCASDVYLPINNITYFIDSLHNSLYIRPLKLPFLTGKFRKNIFRVLF